MKTTTLKLLGIALLACGAAQSRADEQAVPGHPAPEQTAPGQAAPGQTEESPWRLGIAFGYGERSNPLVLSVNLPVIIDLDIAWFGERFFFDNGDVGWTFADNAAVTASFVGRFNSDRVFFGKTDTRFVNIELATGQPLSDFVQVTVPDRDYAIEAGVELLTDGRWGYLQFAAHHDVSGTHDGFALDLDYGIGWRSERWYFEPSVGVGFKSAALNDYYWGVRPDESNSAVPEYEAGAGVNVSGRLLASYYVTPHWALSFAAEYERINDEAAASPIVAESDVIGFFAGMRYRF